ncbi:integrase/recombinase XerD [Bradyrhizobium japonicum]
MMDLFVRYLQEEDKSENTIKGYVQSVSGFLNWFDQSKGTEFKKLHRENVREYISYLKTVKNSKPKTINTKINALVKFNEFLIESGVQEDRVLTKKDYVKYQQQYSSLAKFEYKEVEKFRQLILESGNKRNYALITLLAYTGLRISEALNLKLKDVDFVADEIVVKDGKGSKTRIVELGDVVKKALKGWLKERGKIEGDDYLFVSNRNKRLDRTTINKIFTNTSQELGMNITPHDLRHFFCSQCFKIGMDLREVMTAAGHSNPYTTTQYTHPTKKALKEKMNKLWEG